MKFLLYSNFEESIKPSTFWPLIVWECPVFGLDYSRIAACFGTRKHPHDFGLLVMILCHYAAPCYSKVFERF